MDSGVAGRRQGLAARRADGEQQRHAEGEAAEDQRDGRDLPEGHLGGDEGDPPEDDGEEDAEAGRRGGYVPSTRAAASNGTRISWWPVRL